MRNNSPQIAKMIATQAVLRQSAYSGDDGPRPLERIRLEHAVASLGEGLEERPTLKRMKPSIGLERTLSPSANTRNRSTPLTRSRIKVHKHLR